jgi:hypothetical protein
MALLSTRQIKSSLAVISVAALLASCGGGTGGENTAGASATGTSAPVMAPSFSLGSDSRRHQLPITGITPPTAYQPVTVRPKKLPAHQAALSHHPLQTALQVRTPANTL